MRSAQQAKEILPALEFRLSDEEVHEIENFRTEASAAH
jgi:aryl-alcohol dehydrogenase-like predicted oxidoreductase